MGIRELTGESLVTSASDVLLILFSHTVRKDAWLETYIDVDETPCSIIYKVFT